MDVSNCGPAPSLYVHYRRSLVGYSRPFLASLIPSGSFASRVPSPYGLRLFPSLSDRLQPAPP